MNHSDLVSHALKVSSPAQCDMISKALKVGWTITRVFGYEDTGKFGVAMILKGTSAWVLPCGKLDRGKVFAKDFR